MQFASILDHALAVTAMVAPLAASTALLAAATWWAHQTMSK